MARLVDLYDGFLFDLEGLFGQDNEPIPFAGETLAVLPRAAYISTDVTLTPVEVAEMLADAGVAAHHDQVVTQSHAAARLLTGLVTARPDEFVLGTTPPNRAEDEPTYPPLIRYATTLLDARFPLVVTASPTCVASARVMRLPSVLLLTPDTDLDALLRTEPALRPTFVATDIRDLVRHQPIVDCDARYWSCEGWIATVSQPGVLRLYPGPLDSVAAGARVMCAAAWNWPGSTLDTREALALFDSLVKAMRPD